MRLCTLTVDGREDVGIAVDGGIVRLSVLAELTGTALGPTLFDIVVGDQLGSIREALADPPARAKAVHSAEVAFGPIYRHPPKLWGVGLNFRGHAADLDVEQPVGTPGSYLRPSSCVIGDGDEIVLPAQSDRVTAEAELGVVIGRTCRDVAPQDAASVIFGYTTILDMTAEDAIRVNPRYIPWSKAFDTFCSLGPWIVTPDEVADLSSIRISTVVNGDTIATNQVSAMMRDPYWQVAHFSGGMTLDAGSVLSTGTPGAGVIQDGDVVEAVVEGIGTLRNTVRRAAR
ncbi:2-keto-4-pentenoate hydratase/2-oxohepta-3-ene-1,7-dioic acid hydratase in catechol pathway [Streptomyces sp. 3211.6]|uniref:fumarylacetoacetate hydrolase family protein n=1 Tax=Streptomyces sp. 3211.6 TaxID=1938845 RepID=UPI000EB509DE|nr:fumarylacetoacetate hydrolase family protein [Streptomyces sp. 3211.6]RKT07944.1 2-keto-4-pentenoate hydratase/2-oxohepta-3-ene-1,7-dioic acid hydratase in catechol pathway [Streptomyces sp. 3211.6]